MIKFLLLDLDDTILDFKAAEEYAISKVLTRHGFAPTALHLEEYARINRALWEKLERRELAIDEVLHSRFVEFFRLLGKQVDGGVEETFFRASLNGHAQLLPDAARLLAQWHETHQVYAISNGLYETQMLRLDKAGITHLFHGLFISEQVGVNKPDPRFFDHVARSIPFFSADQALVVGDSLTSDIQGGNLAGIRTCWLNRFHKPFPAERSNQPDFEIHSLTELDGILRLCYDRK